MERFQQDFRTIAVHRGNRAHVPSVPAHGIPEALGATWRELVPDSIHTKVEKLPMLAKKTDVIWLFGYLDGMSYTEFEAEYLGSFKYLMDATLKVILIDGKVLLDRLALHKAEDLNNTAMWKEFGLDAPTKAVTLQDVATAFMRNMTDSIAKDMALKNQFMYHFGMSKNEVLYTPPGFFSCTSAHATANGKLIDVKHAVGVRKFCMMADSETLTLFKRFAAIEPSSLSPPFLDLLELETANKKS
jgi:hypothetical protein